MRATARIELPSTRCCDNLLPLLSAQFVHACNMLERSSIVKQVFWRDYFTANAHLDLAAFRAIALRLFGDSFSARAFPPFNPPIRPKATAAGFFGASVPVLFATIDAAIWFTSFGITRLCLSGQGCATPVKFKLSHYPSFPLFPSVSLFCYISRSRQTATRNTPLTNALL